MCCFVDKKTQKRETLTKYQQQRRSWLSAGNQTRACRNLHKESNHTKQGLNLGLGLKGNKGQNQYLTRVFIRKIQVTFKKCVLDPDKVIFEISPLKVGIRSLGWDHRGRNPDKRS